MIVPLKLLVYNESATYARLIKHDPSLNVEVGKQQLPRAVVELAVAILDAFEEFNLTKAFWCVVTWEDPHTHNDPLYKR